MTSSANPILDPYYAGQASDVFREMDAIMLASKTNELSEADAHRYDMLEQEYVRLLEMARDPVLAKSRRVRPMGDRAVSTATDTDITILTRAETLAALPEYRSETPVSLGKYVRGIVTGDWRNAETERAMSTGTGSAGGYLVPTPLAATVLDLARGKSRIFEAGALTVPMDTNTLTLARVTGDATASWHIEADSITPTDLTLGALVLRARTMTVLVKVSRELFEDAQNLGDVIGNSLGQTFALAIDDAVLYGTGGAQPSGLVNTSGWKAEGMDTNGAAFTATNVSKILAAYSNVETANHEVTAMLAAPRTINELAALQSATEKQPLQLPRKVERVPLLASSQVRTDRTHGSTHNASELFIGDWSKMLVGMRVELGIELLRERFITDSGEYAFLGWMRLDMAATDIAAFSAVTGIIPPSP